MRNVSQSHCYAVVSRPREKTIHYHCKILIHGHFELHSSNIGDGALGIQCEVITMTQQDTSVVPKRNEEPSTLDAFEERVILYVMGTKKEERYL